MGETDKRAQNASTEVHSFRVEGDPVGKGRPRATSIGGKVRMYTPKRTMAYENRVTIAAEHLPKLNGPLSVVVEVVKARPKTRPQWATLTAWRTGYRLVCPVKPDLDNVVKAVLDGLRLKFDDKQVCRLVSQKVCAAAGELPHVLVTVRRMEVL